METLKSAGLYDYNFIEEPKLIYPSEKQVTLDGKKLTVTLDPWSVNVIVLKFKK
jgi:alpha-L-arabinofuranosidase